MARVVPLPFAHLNGDTTPHYGCLFNDVRELFTPRTLDVRTQTVFGPREFAHHTTILHSGGLVGLFLPVYTFRDVLPASSRLMDTTPLATAHRFSRHVLDDLPPVATGDSSFLTLHGGLVVTYRQFTRLLDRNDYWMMGSDTTATTTTVVTNGHTYLLHVLPYPWTVPRWTKRLFGRSGSPLVLPVLPGS